MVKVILCERFRSGMQFPALKRVENSIICTEVKTSKDVSLELKHPSDIKDSQVTSRTAANIIQHIIN